MEEGVGMEWGGWVEGRRCRRGGTGEAGEAGATGEGGKEAGGWVVAVMAAAATALQAVGRRQATREGR